MKNINPIKARDFKNIVILTGAGISADSGLATFRDSNGHWENHKVEDVATPEAYARDPHLVWKFYSMRRLQAAKAHPNAAHHALVEFARRHTGSVHLITQNVDGLHDRADESGDLPPLSMHGTLNFSRCTKCAQLYLDDHAYFDEKGDYAPQETELCTPAQKAHPEYLHHFPLAYKDFLPLSPCCRSPLRPHIVWFGEMPLLMGVIQTALSLADLFVSIGTSGQVYPAAGFLELAKMKGAKTVCLNKEHLPQNRFVDEFIQGKAIDTVSDFFS
jgi:NAD-dependent deacetylase